MGHIVPFYFAVEDISYLAFPMSFSFISSSSTLILLWGLSYPPTVVLAGLSLMVPHSPQAKEWAGDMSEAGQSCRGILTLEQVTWDLVCDAKEFRLGL